MEKPSSYYDWELKFKKNSKSKKIKKNHKKKGKKLTSLGINKEDLANFLNEWRRKNLISK